MRFTALGLLAMLLRCSLQEQGEAAATGGVGGTGAASAGGSAPGGGGTGAGWSSGGQDASLAGSSGGGGTAGASLPDALVDDGALDCTAYPGSTPFVVNGSTHCYWRSAAPGKFADAVAGCSALGAYLVSLHSEEENEHVRGLAGPDTLWIGLTDNKKGDDPSCGAQAFGWVSGEPLAFTKWTDNNPDCVCGSCDGVCDCQHRAAMLPDGGWRDRFEGDPYFWVCEVGPLVP